MPFGQMADTSGAFLQGMYAPQLAQEKLAGLASERQSRDVLTQERQLAIQAQQRALQEQADFNKGLQDVYSSLPKEDTTKEQPLNLQIQALSALQKKAGVEGNGALWKMYGDELVKAEEKQANIQTKNIKIDQDSREAEAAAINAILVGTDKNNRVSPEAVEAAYKRIAPYNKQAADAFVQQLRQNNGVLTPEMQQGLKARMAGALGAKTWGDITHKQVNEALAAKRERDWVEQQEQNRAERQQRAAEHRELMRELRGKATEKGQIHAEGDFSVEGDMSTFKGTSGEVYTAKDKDEKSIIANLNGPQDKPGVYERRSNVAITAAMDQAIVIGTSMKSFLKGKEPALATTGVYSELKGKDFLSATTADLTRRGTDERNMMYKALMAPAKKMVTALEQAGYPSNAATMQAVADSITSESSEPEIVKLQKLGEFRQQVRAALDAVSTSTTTNRGQREVLIKAFRDWTDAIPFNQPTVIDYSHYTKNIKEKPTLKGLLKFTKIPRFNTPEEARTLKPGTKFIDSDGNVRTR